MMAHCQNCGETVGEHCRECLACPEQHAYWCTLETVTLETATLTDEELDAIVRHAEAKLESALEREGV